MNGVISLIHFCEAHGPTVMFCTQSIHKDQQSWSLTNFSQPPPRASPPITNQTNPYDAPELSLKGGINNYMGGLSYASSVFGSSQTTNTPLPSSFPNPTPPPPPTNFQLPANYSQEFLPSTSNRFQEAELKQRTLGRSSQFSHCNACSPRFSSPTSNGTAGPWSDSGRGYLSQDPQDLESYYTSTRYPSHPRLYAALRQACVRSLSCEFCPGREGPVLFGDEKHGYTLSYMFKVHDDRARGSQRFYALSLLMTDRLYLISSATYLIGKFRSLARFLQSRAAPPCRGETDRKGRAHSLQLRSGLIPPDPEPNRRAALPLIPSGRSMTGDGGPPTAAPTMLTSDQFLRRRSSTHTKQLRTLEELLELPHLMAMLHASFVLILSGGSRRLLESPPMPLQKWAEPTTVLMDVLPLSRDTPAAEVPCSPGSSLGSSCSTPHFRLDHLGQLYHLLGRSQFGRLIFNLGIGNQVVIRSSSPAIISDIMVVLQDIMPQLCFRKLEYEEVYQPIWLCNLLGLHREVDLPEDVDLTSLVLLEVDAPGYRRGCGGGTSALMALSHGLAEPPTGNPILVGGSFGFVSEVVSIVQQGDPLQTHLSPHTVDHLHALSPNPSKPSTTLPPLFSTSGGGFGFSTNEEPTLSPKQLRLKLIAVKESWSCKGRMFAQFLMQLASINTVTSQEGEDYPNRLQLRILELLKVGPPDLPIIRFFATAFRPRSSSTTTTAT